MLALSLIVRAPVRLPIAVGVNVTFMVQLAPPGIPVPQVWLATPKSPLVAMEAILSGVFRLFVSVMTFAALVVPAA